MNDCISANVLKELLNNAGVYRYWTNRSTKFKWPDLESSAGVPASTVMFFIFRHSLKTPVMTLVCCEIINRLSPIIDEGITRGLHSNIPSCKVHRESKEAIPLLPNLIRRGECSRRDTRGVTIPSHPQAAGRPPTGSHERAGGAGGRCPRQVSAGGGAFPPPKFGGHCKGC